MGFTRQLLQCLEGKGLLLEKGTMAELAPSKVFGRLTPRWRERTKQCALL